MAQVGHDHPSRTGNAHVPDKFTPGMGQLGKRIPILIGDLCFIGCHN
jgi:hypothetical protein